MSTTETLLQRNAEFATERFHSVPEIPSFKTALICCLDPRADPAHVLGLEPGEAAVVRNAGGRVTPAALQILAMTAMIAAQAGQSGGFEVILMHHTDCGVGKLAQHEELLAGYFEVPVEALPHKHVADPFAAVGADIEVMRANPMLPDDLVVSGLVYEVENGKVATAVEPAPLRS